MSLKTNAMEAILFLMKFFIAAAARVSHINCHKQIIPYPGNFPLWRRIIIDVGNKSL